MKHLHLRCVCVVLFVLYTSNPLWVNAEFDDDSWMEPDAWSQQNPTLNEQCCKCAEVLALSGAGENKLEHQETSKYTEDGVAFMYLKRWMTLLFDRKMLMHDDQLKMYERSLTFLISSSQLDQIEKWKDPRDLDEVLTEIIVNSFKNKPRMGCDGHYHTPGKATGFKTLVVDIFVDVFKLTKTSEVRFLLMAALVAICGWFLHKRYHISYITLVAGGLFLFGYLHTYLECNRELALNEMIEVLKSAEKKQQSGFMRFLSYIFSSSNDDEQHQQLRKSTKINLGFCRPDHVIIMYFNDIFLKYLQVMLEQCSGTLKALQLNLPWPYNHFASIMLIFIIGYLLKLTFKYILSPAAWGHMMHRNPLHHNMNQSAALTQGDAHVHNIDRISGDNLKALLGIIKSSTEPKQKTTPAVSGVEEVREAIESAPVNDTSTSSVSNSDTSAYSPSKAKKNNNDPAKEPVTKYNDVTMEDLPDDT